MNTEKAYRDIGEAVVKGYLDRGIYVGISRIEVYAQRIGTKDVVFYIGNNLPVATFGPHDLKQIAEAHVHTKRREASTDD